MLCHSSISINMSSSVIFLWLCLVVWSLLGVQSFLLKKDTVCYKQIDCFSSGSPFRSPTRPLSVTPSSPDHIRTQFVLYTRTNPSKPQKLDARKVGDVRTKWTAFKTRQTQFLVHGFLDDYNIITWCKKMKDVLLRHDDYNTIIVDWSHGNLAPYTQASANARVVGAQIALLVKQLQKDFNMSPSQFHIIGHSLGCHVAGYAGERVPGFGRITGLDPAGPFFQGTDKVVRLDPSDAEFVDVIHSDGKEILKLGLGMLQPSGDLDFYPNMGHDQPGCKPDIFKNFKDYGLVHGLREIIGCNHLRAVWYFMESIDSKCPFTAIPCESADDFKANKCNTCPPGGCASMGFKADQHKPPTGTSMNYYVTTASASPFCQYHLDIKIKMSSGARTTEERGRLKIRFRGSKGSSGWIRFDTKAKDYIPGSTYRKTLGVPADLGDLRFVELTWHHVAPLTNPLKWNLFGLRHPTLYINEIGVVREEYGKHVVGEGTLSSTIPAVGSFSQVLSILKLVLSCFFGL